MIFTISIILLPWVGWFLDQGRGTTNQQESLGWLLFIVSPVLASILLRIFGRDGWKDAGLAPQLKGNLKWYVFALLFHPLIHLTLLVAGYTAGAIQIPDFSGAKSHLVGQAILATLGFNFIKNIFEEFAWRGYLAPKMQELMKNTLLGHLIVGTIWFLWHLPYYLVLLSPQELRNFTALPLGTFLFLVFLALLAASVVYGEVRLRTRSVWPAVILHTSSNVLLGAMVSESFFKVAPQWEIWLSPGWTSLASILIFGIVGGWLYGERIHADIRE
jgi:membrane protease YdiL (CAAX protease family)